jgi:hypothetical protein
MTMLARIVVAWLCGAAFASAWWSLTVSPHLTGHAEFCIPVFVTIIMVALTFMVFPAYWDDK